MYILKSASLAALAGAVLAFGIASASAGETASVSTCVDMAKQVKAALAANAQSANYSDAAKQQRYGLEFCNGGRYQSGLDHYAAALKLLDPAKS